MSEASAAKGWERMNKGKVLAVCANCKNPVMWESSDQIAAAPAGWWCPVCKVEPHPAQVTNDERHETCGTYIGDVGTQAEQPVGIPEDLKVFYDWCCDLNKAAYPEDLIKRMGKQLIERIAQAEADKNDLRENVALVRADGATEHDGQGRP